MLMMIDGSAYFSLRMWAERETMTAVGTSHENRVRPRQVKAMLVTVSQGLFSFKEPPKLRCWRDLFSKRMAFRWIELSNP